MTEEKFKKIQDLQDKIEVKRRCIRSIESLLSSCGLSCKVTGTPKNYRTQQEYLFSNKEEIKKLLSLEKSMAEFDLDVLLKEFQKL